LINTDQPPAQQEQLQVQYASLLKQLGEFIRSNAADANLELIYFALCNATYLMRAKLRELGISEAYLRKVEHSAKVGTINAANIAANNRGQKEK
jgi:hypothetical protein